MKFPPFDFVRPATLEEAVAVLAADEDAKALAGGQSLLPLMALRLARPTTVVDISGLGLQGVGVAGTEGPPALRIGALTTHTRVLDDPLVARAAPLLAAAAAHVGHPAIRNRGTLGGSLAHADPAAELPAAVVALGGWVEVTGPDGGRTLLCADLIDGYFVNTLAPGELVTAVVVPASGAGAGAGWCEWAPRTGDFAEVGVGVCLSVGADGSAGGIRAAACGIGGGPLDLGPALGGASGARGDDAAVLRLVASDVAEQAASGGDDQQAEMAGLLAARALRRAYIQATASRQCEVEAWT